MRLFPRQLDIGSVCHTQMRNYNGDTSIKLHFSLFSMKDWIGGQIPWSPPITHWQSLCNWTTLLGTSGIWFTRQTQTSQLIKLSLSAPKTPRTHISILPPPPTANTHNAHGTCIRPWRKSNAATAVQSHSWQGPWGWLCWIQYVIINPAIS